MNNPLVAEFIGTAILLLLGCGIVANVNLKKTKAEGQTPWVLITSAWGFSVFVGAYVAGKYNGIFKPRCHYRATKQENLLGKWFCSCFSTYFLDPGLFIWFILIITDKPRMRKLS